MRKIIALLSIVALSTVLTGCVGLGGIAKVVEAAGTKDKEIDTEFSGWNANWKYKSKPARWDAPSSTMTTNRTDGGFLVIPETTLRVEKSK